MVILNKILNETPRFRGWVLHNIYVVSFVTVVSCTNLESLNILNSKIFHLAMFSSGWDRRISYIIEILGIFVILLEDIPQMTIQVGFFFYF